MYFSTKDLQVGDKVLVLRMEYGKKYYYEGIIKKKTPTGLVDVSYLSTGVTRFKANGDQYERLDRFSRVSTSLVFYDEEIVENVRKEKRRRGIISWLRAYNYDNLTDEELETIDKMIKDFRST